MRALCLYSCFGTHYRYFARPARMRALCLYSCFGTPLRGEGLRPLLLLAWSYVGDIAGARLVVRSWALTRTSTLRRCPGARAVAKLRRYHAAGGRRGKERAASLRAQQRLAAGGRRLPRPVLVRA